MENRNTCIVDIISLSVQKLKSIQVEYAIVCLTANPMFWDICQGVVCLLVAETFQFPWRFAKLSVIAKLQEILISLEVCKISYRMTGRDLSVAKLQEILISLEVCKVSYRMTGRDLSAAKLQVNQNFLEVCKVSYCMEICKVSYCLTGRDMSNINHIIIWS